MLMFPDRLAAGLKTLDLPTVVRIHLWEFFILWCSFNWEMRVFEPREFFRAAQNSVVLPFYGTLICTARAARLQLS